MTDSEIIRRIRQGGWTSALIALIASGVISEAQMRRVLGQADQTADRCG